jgi:beta-lactamase superfamily II metal-dependent hydrolase
MKKEIRTYPYPTTSNVFENDVHRTPSPILPTVGKEVLNPTSTFSDVINQNSIVLKMTYGSVSFLFMGDANADAESKITNSGTNLQADILKVGHHGSAMSSSSAFLSKAQPKTSVIEVGAGIPPFFQFFIQYCINRPL